MRTQEQGKGGQKVNRYDIVRYTSIISINPAVLGYPCPPFAHFTPSLLIPPHPLHFKLSFFLFFLLFSIVHPSLNALLLVVLRVLQHPCTSRKLTQSLSLIDTQLCEITYCFFFSSSFEQ